jgi:hypothetical protein
VSGETDPAIARFAAINLVRIGGIACVVVGMLIASGRILPGVPVPIAYAALAVGLFGALVAPALLVRKWRTPK